MSKRLTLIGAYGRVYMTKDAALKDWHAGKDFKICLGPYCSIRDISVMVRRYDTVEIMLHTGERVTITV